MLTLTPNQPAEQQPDALTLLRAFANLSAEDPPPGITRFSWRMAISKARAFVAAQENQP